MNIIQKYAFFVYGMKTKSQTLWGEEVWSKICRCILMNICLYITLFAERRGKEIFASHYPFIRKAQTELKMLWTEHFCNESFKNINKNENTTIYPNVIQWGATKNEKLESGLDGEGSIKKPTNLGQSPIHFS